MELGRLFGFLHPALVHFPLVLLIVSIGLEFAAFARRSERLAWAAQLTLVLGTIATLFAFVCGNFAEIWAARDGIPQDPMEIHENYATVTSWLFVFLAAARFFLKPLEQRRAMGVYLGCALVGCILLIVTGHKGAMLVYQHAAGVQLPASPPLPSHEDLAVLRQKQDPDALFYSNNMHHIFGWMVMILSLLLMVDLASPRLGSRLRAVTPFLLICGGVFLLIWSDTDSWPLSNQRPLTDKEVLMHKTYSVLMLFFGGQALIRRRKRSANTDADARNSAASGRQGRMMAVFSLIGGALLFTHVHSNAPYANVAVGVYIHHTVMGCIALAIGAVRLASDFVPQHAMTAYRVLLTWAYPCLMLTQSVFLLNYNEGLPWFLGYAGIGMSAPHAGLTAPLGRRRAELTYDPKTQRVDVYLLRRADDMPAPTSQTSLQAVLRVGTDSTCVELQRCDEPNGNHHFRGTASFLDGQRMFQAQVLLREGRRTDVADFEPWTDATAAVTAHSQSAFVCPMHPAVGSGSAGRCAVCGMSLVPNRGVRVGNRLVDEGYGMSLEMSQPAPLSTGGHDVMWAPGSATSAPAAHQQVRLRFRIAHSGRPVSRFEIVHTKPLHLILVSKDLSYFDHLHPELQADGAFILDYIFPAAGDFVLFADCTPRGDRNQVFREVVTVAGPRPAARELEVTPARARAFGDYRVRLDLSPDPAMPKDETQLSFTLFERGVPVTNLEPYLGAGGHCVALSEDTESYLHSHPLEMAGSVYGPTVTFHTIFPKPGLYKIWGQFQHRGKVVVSDFVVRIP